MKVILLSTIFIFFTLLASAQNETGSLVSKKTTVRLTGIIEDSITSKKITRASVELRVHNLSGSVANAATDFKKNTIATDRGKFVIENIPSGNKYILAISAIGYETGFREINLASLTGSDKKIINKNIGPIRLVQQPKQLNNITITVSAPPVMKFGIDSKIFNVEKNITAQGGTAVDVMKNIPSVSVDADGNVQMRNSTPQILIDSRPTILTLDQIPASDIEKVELITNPSSKFDASNAGGIINIVMKKNKRSGLNGLVSIGAGTPGLLNGNINLNLRNKNFNFFVTGNYNESNGKIREETYRENKNNYEITDYFYETTENKRLRKFNSLRFGADYFLDNNNTLSFTQSFNSGDFNNNKSQDQEYFNQFKFLRNTGLRNSLSPGSFNRSSSRLSFESKFSKPDHKLTADITYNKGSRGNSETILNQFYYPDGSMYTPDIRVRNTGSGIDEQVTGQIDYTDKKSEEKRIEFGVRTYYNSNATNFDSYSVDHINNETKLPLSNNYKYKETVNAGYINYANKWKSFTYQVGLRIELSKFDGNLIDSNLHFGYKFPDGLKNLNYAFFPAFFVIKALNENEDIQFSYSKRIRRPRFWEVNPFVDINDPLNIRQGNPALRPEYTNSFELNYFNKFKKNSGSFLGVLYFKNNVGDVTRYSDIISPALYQQLNYAAISSDAILNTFINAGYTNRMGAEFTLRKKIVRQLDLTYNIDLQYRTTKAAVNNTTLNNKGFNFDTKLITNYKIVTDKSRLFNNLSFQLIANYQSPRVIPQGKIKERFVSDFALRKEFLRKKTASLSLSINDIFNTRKFGTIYDTENFYQDSYRRWNVRSFRVTFSYKFGDLNLNLFRKKDISNDEVETEGAESDRALSPDF